VRSRAAGLALPAALAAALLAAAAAPAAPAAAQQVGPADARGWSRRSVSGVAAVNGTRLWYEVQGRGPVVVLVHGGALDRRMWAPQWDALAREFTVVRYDVRGYGRSARPDGTPYASHEDLAALLAHLGVTRAAVVGLSLGGRIALDLALAHPGLVERLVVSGAAISGFPADAAAFAWYAPLKAAGRHRDSLAVAEAWLGSDYLAHAMRERRTAATVRRLTLANAGMFTDTLNVERVLAPPAVERLESIAAPTLVIIGLDDNPAIRRMADTLVARVPGARRAELPGTGHLPNLERPAEFTHVLRSFLRETQP